MRRGVLGLLAVHWVCAAPLQYPLDPSTLIKCPDERSGWLCRPQVEYTQETLNYIQTLKINDPYFYDVFEESEIYQYFRPVNESKAPSFYLWEDDRLRNLFLDSPAWFQDVYSTFMQDLKLSPSRTHNESNAVLHYLAFPWKSDAIREKAAEEFAEHIWTSPEFNAYQGANFFYTTSSWLPEVDDMYAGKRYFEAIIKGYFDVMAKPKKKYKSISSDIRLRLQTTGLHYGSLPLTRSCTVLTHYTAPTETLGFRTWPTGNLESYMYPLGHYAQLLKTRRHKFFFAGQVDTRPAYRPRLALLSKNVQQICDAGGVIMRTDGGPLPLEDCKMSATCRCAAPSAWRKGFMVRRLGMDSVFGLHIRGDDFYSARIAEIFGLGSIPIIVGKNLYTWGMAGQCSAPWRKMAIIVDEEQFILDPGATVTSAIEALTHQDLEKMIRLLYYYRGSAIHGFLESTVVEERLKEIAHECLPQTILQQLSFTKSRSQLCPFEELTPRPSFLNVADEDDMGFPWNQALTAKSHPTET